MSRRATRHVLAALCGVAPLLGCGQAESRGSIMLAISTDMYVDKDLDRVDIIVQPETGPAQSIPVNLFPATAGLYLPGTFSIVEGSQPGEFVRVRIVARKGSAQARVVREAALRIPRERTALLPMPIQWLCDGHVRGEGQQVRSDCPEAQTCISGSCQSDLIEESLLATYRAEDVFGGGTATGGGECFDMLGCFEQSSEPALDPLRCVLSTPPGDDLNVAALLPPGGDGHCTAESCWIPLDASPLTGWAPTEDGDGVQLPRALCTLVSDGTATIRVSRACASKTPATPTCGEWTLVGSEPGDVPLPPVASPPLRLDAELRSLGNTLAERVASACAAVAQQSPPANPSATDLSSLCQQAASAVATSAPLSWYHLPARCAPDGERQLACEASCGSCAPGTLLERCEVNSVSSSCDGACDSRRCLGSSEVPTQCTGACVGQLVGQCQGNCLGSCDGECSQVTPEGRCDGTCSGTCTGLCAGRATGSCSGLCDGDPNLAPSACSAGSLCLGSCAGERTNTSCTSQLGTSPCSPDGCIGDCGAIGRIDLDCQPATSWVLPPPGQQPSLDPSQVRNVEAALSELISVRDAEAPPALDEATRLIQRLTAAPATPAVTLAQAEAALSLLTAARDGASFFISALGAPRTALGGAPPITQPNSCEPFQSPGSAGLIDDFEDGDGYLLPNDGRVGAWHIGQDGTGTLDQSEPPQPVAGGANDSSFALRLSGRGFTNWGANTYFELRAGSSPYDASVHRGIKFWARGSGQLRVILTQQNLAPTHSCSTCAPESGECGLFYSTLVPLSEDWTEHILNWAAFEAPAVILTPLAPDQLMKIEFEAPAPEPVDFWLDDIAFTDTIF